MKVDKLVIVSEYFSDNYPKLTKFSRFIQKALLYIGIAGQGNNIVFLRSYINRILSE